MELNNKHRKILEVLKKGELAISKIAFLISSNLYHVEALLNELYEEGLVEFEKRNNATYWRLKNGS